MPWVVDTCVLIDVLEDDPKFGQSSADALLEHLEDGLVVSPITYVELAPAFNGSPSLQDEFLVGVGVDHAHSWTQRDTQTAHKAWAEHIERRRKNTALKRPVADILIGAFACRFDGLITRNPSDFRRTFEALNLVDTTP